MAARANADHKESQARQSRIRTYEHLREALAEGGASAAITASRAGLPATLLASLARHYGIPRQRAYRLAGISPATADRKIRRQERLAPVPSERLTRIAQMEVEAIDVLGSEKLAHRWLETPNSALGGESPLEMTDTGYGVDAVLRLLSAIRYGGAA